MTDTIRVCAVQFTREVDLRHNVHKAGGYLLDSHEPDFALIGGEFSINESRFSDPYPPLADLAQSFRCNIIAPIDAVQMRYPHDIEDNNYFSMHVFNRSGKVVGIQDRRYLSDSERARGIMPGRTVRVFEVEGVKIGLARGMDILHPAYTQQLRAAEILFVSALAIDDVMLEAAKIRAFENRCYVVLATFVGCFLGQELTGNAAIIEPVFMAEGVPQQARVVQHSTGVGVIEADLDLTYIRRLKTGRLFEYAGATTL